MRWRWVGLAGHHMPVLLLVAALGLPFVTVDLAIRSDGVWRVIELGDGQVSDRPATITPEALMTALCTCGPTHEAGGSRMVDGRR